MKSIRYAILLGVSIVNWFVFPAFANNYEELGSCASCHLPTEIQAASAVDDGSGTGMPDPLVQSRKEPLPERGAIIHMLFKILCSSGRK